MVDYGMEQAHTRVVSSCFMGHQFYLLFAVGIGLCIPLKVSATEDLTSSTRPSNITSSLSNPNLTVHADNHQVIPTASVLERPNVTSKWPLNQALPVVGQTFSRCKLRSINWANHSLGQLILLDHVHAVRWFDASFGKRQAHSADTSKSDSHKSRHFSKTPSLDCHFVFIYSTKCPFSVAALPFVKALARAFPQFLFHAVQVEDYTAHRWSLRMLYVPKFKLIVDGRIIREYSGSDTNLDGLIDFVWINTRQVPKGPIGLQSADYQGNPPTPHSGNALLLILSWLTVISSAAYLLCIFGPTITAHLSTLFHRLSCGRLGKAPEEPTSGTLLTWDPGHLVPRDC
ncbi:hypothetical protein CSKR_100739 [Clonorchis sinensis]|uniref:Thioredoxin domain-containing protein 15 n=1 Tax=Clonorchis sinensis TaxID=79923 RepID=A0A3R7CV76_CLOSI|nr:hypothetical protein CSKR_100739 [Clonorchis sinensis]